MSISEIEDVEDLLLAYPSSFVHEEVHAEFNLDDFIQNLDYKFEKSSNVVFEEYESVQTSALKYNNNLLNFEESGKPVEQFMADGAQDRLNYMSQSGVPRSELSFKLQFEEEESMLVLEDEFAFEFDLQYTNHRLRRASEPSISTTNFTPATTVEPDEIIKRSSKSNQQISNGVANCGEEFVDVQLHKTPTQHLGPSSVFINSDQLSRPLYDLGSTEELDADDILLRNTLMMKLEDGVSPSWENQCTHSHGSNDELKELDVNPKKRKSSTDKPRGESGSPRKKKKMEIEEPLLQNLPGLQSIRVSNGLNEYSTFESVDEIDPVGDIENPGNQRYINYSYEIGPRARVNAYEPTVVRKKHTDVGNGGGYEGLCPYCPQMKFLLMNTSAYLHHMTTQHGVFSNGLLVEEPGACIKQVLVNNGKTKNVEYFTCPYECELKLIRMKKINPASPMECRYKVYLRHVKDCHGCGKRDNQIKRDV